MLGSSVARPGIRGFTSRHAVALAGQRGQVSAARTPRNPRPLTSILIANRGEIALSVYYDLWLQG